MHRACRKKKQRKNTCRHTHLPTDMYAYTHIYMLRSIETHTLVYIDKYCYTCEEASLGQKEAQEGPEEAENGHKGKPKTAKEGPRWPR